MNERDEVRLRDMLDAAEKAQKFMQGKSKADLENDDLLSFGVVRALEIVGKAASKVSPETRQQYQDIKWKDIIGMRNRMIHDYRSVDLLIVWKTIEQSIPEIIAQLTKILPPLEE